MSHQHRRHRQHHRPPATPMVSLMSGFKPDSLFSIAVFVLIGLCLVLGGGSRENALPVAMVELYALALAPFAVHRLAGGTALRPLMLPLILCILALLIPLLQLIPLPPALWSALPGRELAREGYAAAGLPLPWAPISLTPALTFHALAALTPAVVIFLSTISLSAAERRVALLVVLGGVLLGIFIGALQVVLGARGFYSTVHTGLPIGFFANRNHTALLMVCSLPILATLIAMTRQSRESGVAVTLLGAAALFAILVTLALLQSRAGVLLFLPAMAGAVFLALRSGWIRRSRMRTWVVAAAVIGGIGLAVAVGLSAILLRFDTDPGQDLRFAAAPDVWKAALAHMPLGSGLGSFDTIYRSVERTPLLTPVFFNHAHNDYLELLLETGWLGLAALLLFFAWLPTAAWRAWKRQGPQANLAQAGTVIVLLMLLHSTVDYPLRTFALCGLFAFACALFAAPVAADESAQSHGGDRVRRRRPIGEAGPRDGE